MIKRKHDGRIRDGGQVPLRPSTPLSTRIRRPCPRLGLYRLRPPPRKPPKPPPCVGGRMLPGRPPLKRFAISRLAYRLAIAKTWIVVHPTRPLPIYPLPQFPRLTKVFRLVQVLAASTYPYGDCDSDPLDAGQQQSKGQVSDRGGRKAGLGPEHSGPTLAAGVLRSS